jgi:hypothetical protein
MSKLVNLFGNSINHGEMNKKASLGVFVVVASFLLLAGSVSYAQDRRQRQDPQDSVDRATQQEEAANALAAQIPAQATTTICSDLSFGNNLNTPGIDTYRVRCAAATTIRARVLDNGPFNDNTFHVTNLCVLPDLQRGRGDKEWADPGPPGTFPEGGANRNPSEFAESPANCQESIVEIGCDRHDFCDDTYCVTLECVGRAFAPGFPAPRINR